MTDRSPGPMTPPCGSGTGVPPWCVTATPSRAATGAGDAPEEFEERTTPRSCRPPGCPVRAPPARPGTGHTGEADGTGAGGRPPPPSRHFSGHSFQARWYTVLMSPSVESIVMKLTLDGSLPAVTLSSVLMLKLRWTPQGA